MTSKIKDYAHAVRKLKKVIEKSQKNGTGGRYLQDLERESLDQIMIIVARLLYDESIQSFAQWQGIADIADEMAEYIKTQRENSVYD